MKTYLFTFLLLWLLPTVVLGQSINIDQDKNKTVYFDYTSFSELVLAGDGADTGQLAQRISEFFTSTPFSFVSPEIANDYKYNKVQFYTTLKPTQKFLQAYALFISKEIAVYSDSVVKLISPDVTSAEHCI